MKQILMLTNSICLMPEGFEATIYSGQIVDLNNEEADRFLNNGLAQFIKEYENDKPKVKDGSVRGPSKSSGNKRLSKGGRKRR